MRWHSASDDRRQMTDYSKSILTQYRVLSHPWICLPLITLCVGCASTQPAVDTNVTIDFPSTQRIENIEQADAVLNAATLSRAQVEWRFQHIEQICYDKFFVNSCLLKAKDQRRVDLERIKKSEVEANRFKRQHTVEELDKSLSEKNKQNPAPVLVEPESKNKP